MTRVPCFIVPPHLLHRLSKSDDPRVAERAMHTLACRREIVVRRDVRAARSGTERGNLGGTGLIPSGLVERAVPRPGAVPAPEAPATAVTATPNRSIHDAQHGSDLPGTLVRGEGDPAVQDESANEAYDGLGATFALFSNVYQRNSLDAQGMPLLATVHYQRDFDNAFWDGQQMVFGDGDGEIFNSFTDSVDVIGHELTHGFTQFTAGFTYVAQSGALNESVSDVFGSLVKQHLRDETADQADWLIGEGLFTDQVQGVALRSMKAPGTAYDDPRVGTDPQPATMDDYQDLPHDEQNDNGGVHINSGIPNHAFYRAAVAIGGRAWEKTGQIWYDVMTEGGLPKDTDFATFAAATVTATGDRFGQNSVEQQAVEQAWKDVKVL